MMGAQPDEDEDLNLDLDDENQDDLPNNQDDDADGDDADDDASGDDEDDEFEVSFDGEDAPARGDSSDLVKHLRAENRRLAKEAAEARKAVPPPAPVDETKHAAAVEDWTTRKIAADRQNAEAEQAQQRQQQSIRADYDRFQTQKAAIGARDFEAAEDAVAATLSREQVAAIIQGADDSAKVVYALGRHPDRLKALAAETNIVKFIAKVAKLEGSVKVTNRRQAPAPDRPARGSAPFGGGSDKTLAKLEAEAERTGDRTKIHEYRRQKRERAAGK
jgi:hypothetical protein